MLFFDPISYLWSGKPDLYAKQIIQKLSSLISGLQKIFRSHTISSTGKFSSKQFSKIKIFDPRKKKVLQKAENESNNGRHGPGNFLHMLMLRQLRWQMHLLYPQEQDLHVISTAHSSIVDLLYSLQQCTTQLHFCLFPGPVPSSYFFLEVQRPMACTQQNQGTSIDLVLVWAHFRKIKSRQQALLNTPALFCNTRGKQGVFLTTNRWWLKLW